MGVLDILNPIKGLIKPVANLIDELHTSSEEKGQLSNALAALQFGIAEKVIGYQLKVLEYEGKLAESRRDVIVAEAQGESWLQRNWRPTLMLTFGYIIAHNHIFAPMFGLAYLEIPEKMWTLLSLGIGGYIVGRSGEKVVPKILQVIRETRTKE